MKIEILYPEICTLFGDKGNMQYLRLCLPNAEFIETTLNAKPRFLTEPIDLVYMCSMSERSQEAILSRLLEHKDAIKEAIDSQKTVFLFTGNSFELLGSYIEREDGSRIDALGYVDCYTVRQAPNRFNSLLKASFEGMTLLGYTSRFTHTYGIPENISFCKVELGTGSNPDTAFEGIHKGRLLGTYMLGPLLVSNPDFTHYVLGLLDSDRDSLPYEQALRDAYNHKLKEFENPSLELS